jgi:DNA primase
MFPLTNHRGQTVGFSGRLLAADAKEAKYINSPETQLYHKSELLFGLSQLYQSIRKERRVIVVEGEFDVISSSQVEVNNVVAIKGSALTEDHAKLLRRTVDVVLLALDTDKAGVAATKKAIQTLRPTQIELRVVQIPQGKDPDDLIKTQPQLWRDAVKQSVSAYEFLINIALSQNNPTKPDGKRAIMQELGPILAALDHAVELEHYVKQLSQALGVQPEVIKQDLERSRKQLEMNQNNNDARKNQSARGTSRSSNSDESSEANLEKKSKATKEANQKLTRQERLEKFGLFLLFQSEGEHFFKRANQLNEMPLVTVGAHQVLAAIIKIGENASLQSLRQNLPEDLQQKVFSWYADQQFVENADQLDLPTEWQRTLKDLKTEASKSRRQGIATRLSELDRNPNKSDTELSEQDSLLKELAMLNSSSRVK